MRRVSVFIALVLSGCATGHFCVDDSKVKYEVPIGKKDAPPLQHPWSCYSERYIDPFDNPFKNKNRKKK